MNGNDNPQDPDELYSPGAQSAQQQAGGSDPNSWYYRPSSGMADWAARLGKFQQDDPDGENAPPSGAGPTDGEENPDSQQGAPGGGGESTSPGNAPGLQEMPNFLIHPTAPDWPARGMVPIPPATFTGSDNHGASTDLSQPIPGTMQKSAGDGQAGGTQPVPVSNPSPRPAPTPQQQQVVAPQSQTPANGNGNADIGDIGVPNIAKGANGQWFGGSVATDFDGSFDAYGIRGTPTAYTGKDKLDNASYGMNYIEPKPGKDYELHREDSLDPNIIPRDKNGKALVNSAGYYQSSTAATDTQNPGNYNYVDGEKVPYVALSQQQMEKSHANYGDYVWVENTQTGQGTWAIVGDYRGSVDPASSKKQDIELSPAAQDRIGIKRIESGANRGVPIGNPYVSMTVFPKTSSGRFH